MAERREEKLTIESDSDFSPIRFRGPEFSDDSPDGIDSPFGGWSPPPTEEEILKANYREALKSGVVSVAYARIVHLGAGGVGKSSFQRGMMNKPLPDEANVNSTQMADLSTFQPGQGGASRDVSTHTAKGGSVSGGYWVPVTEDDETNELVGLVRLVYDVRHGETESSRFVKWIQAFAISHFFHTRSSPEISEAQRIIEEIIELAKQHPEIQAPESEVFLYVWDCGGQQVFLCILPAFLTSKSMFFLMFDARKDLHERCLSLSHHQGHATQQVLEQSTIELLLQWMSCIDATLTDKNANESITKMPEYPRILPVGTHGDDPTVQVNKERILELLYTEYKDKDYAYLVREKGVIIDNTTAGQGENADPGYRRVLQIVNDFACSNEVKVDTPLTWVLFRKVLRRMAKNKPYVTLKEVVAVAEACTIPEDSVPSVLKFYHDLAVFLHYDKIPSLSSIVIADPQWLIKQIAKLLALEGFEKEGAPRLWDILRNRGILVEALYAEIWKASTADELDPLPPQSIVDLLKHFLIVAPVNTRGKVHNLKGKEYFVPSVLPPLPTTPQAPQQERGLSSSTRNNAPFDPPSHESRPSTPNNTPSNPPSHERRPSTPYYTPPDSPSHLRNPSTQNDGLSNPPSHKGLSDPPSYDRRAAPLYLVFPDIKYLPPGFFTRLATALSTEKGYDIAFGHGIYRNKVSFTLGQSGSNIDTLTISECKHSIQINLVREKPRECGNPIFPDLCQEVMGTVRRCFSDQISQWFPGIKMAFAFSCDHCKTRNPHTPKHFILLDSEYTTKSCLRCQENKIYEQNKDQKNWLKIAKSHGSTGPISVPEINGVAKEFQLNPQKLADFKDAFEMTTHRVQDPVILIERWIKGMEQIGVPPRPYLIHHLECIDMYEVAEKIEYLELAEKGESPTSHASSSRPKQHQQSDSSQVLTMDDHHAVTRQLKNLTKADLIGLGTALGLYYPRLRKIGGEDLSDEIVAAWLREDDSVTKASGPPTWASLATVLEAVDRTGVASRIRKKYLADKKDTA